MSSAGRPDRLQLWLSSHRISAVVFSSGRAVDARGGGVGASRRSPRSADQCDRIGRSQAGVAAHGVLLVLAWGTLSTHRCRSAWGRSLPSSRTRRSACTDQCRLAIASSAVSSTAYWRNAMQKRALKMMGATDEIGHQQVTSALLGLIIDAGRHSGAYP